MTPPLRDGHVVEQLTSAELSQQIKATVSEEGQTENLPQAGPGRNWPGTSDINSCEAALIAVGVANALVWGAAGLTDPPAVPLALGAGLATGAGLSTLSSMC